MCPGRVQGAQAGYSVPRQGLFLSSAGPVPAPLILLGLTALMATSIPVTIGSTSQNDSQFWIQRLKSLVASTDFYVVLGLFGDKDDGSGDSSRTLYSTDLAHTRCLVSVSQINGK